MRGTVGDVRGPCGIVLCRAVDGPRNMGRGVVIVVVLWLLVVVLLRRRRQGLVMVLLRGFPGAEGELGGGSGRAGGGVRDGVEG